MRPVAAALAALSLLAAPYAFAGQMPAFETDHAGEAASDIDASATWHPVLGPVVHDGVCAYAASGKLGCFDPLTTGDDLACSQPKVAATGVYWLFLHHALFVPFDGSAPQKQPLPLWAYDQTLEDGTDALLVWGMGDKMTQELWRWDPKSATGSAAKLLDGPAEMSGGISHVPDAPGCLALGTYAAAPAVCEGKTTVWKWCAQAPTELTALTTFAGCSGSMALAADGVWVFKSDHAEVHPLTDGPARAYAFASDLLTLVPDAHGTMQAVRFSDGRLSVSPAR